MEFGQGLGSDKEGREWLGGIEKFEDRPGCQKER